MCEPLYFKRAKNPETTLKRRNNLFQSFISVLFHVVRAAQAYMTLQYRRWRGAQLWWSVMPFWQPCTNIITNQTFLYIVMTFSGKYAFSHSHCRDIPWKYFSFVFIRNIDYDTMEISNCVERSWVGLTLSVKKSEHSYSALHGTIHFKALSHGSHSSTCKEHHACLHLVSVRQKAPPLNVVAKI